jgi:hypothetical protein
VSYASLDELRSHLGKAEPSPASAAYAAKMLHEIPETDVVERAKFILQKVAGKRVLEFGASGPMHDAIVKAATFVYGVDRHAAPGVVPFDLDDVTEISLPSNGGSVIETGDWRGPVFTSPDVIVCGEVLEHLANPGYFLHRLIRQYVGVPVIITVPNAFSSAARKSAERGTEQVNKDHVCWYSWKTMSVLLGRYGYEVKEFHFYNGERYTAEGLIFVCE